MSRNHGRDNTGEGSATAWPAPTTAAGLITLALGAERLVNAVMLDGFASYGGTRFIIAAVFATAGLSLIVVGTLTRYREDRGGIQR